MVLNSSSAIPGLTMRNCGMVRYFSNSACHWTLLNGGAIPITGFHSTIESPDRVNRVAPPTITIAKTSPATVSSHNRIPRRCDGSSNDGGVLAVVETCGIKRHTHRPECGSAVEACG